MVDVDVRLSSHLKEELAWAVCKPLRVFSTIMLFKNSKTTKELKRTSRFKFKTIIIVYVAMWPLVTDSNYFKIVSSVTFLDSQTGLISGIFTVILYHIYTII